MALTFAAMPSGVVELEGRLSQAQYDQLTTRLRQDHGGPRNAGKVLIMPEGLKFKPVGNSAQDSEYINSVRVSVEHACRIMGNVPPTIVSDLTNSSYANFSTSLQFFAVHCVQPIVKRIEAEFDRSVFGVGSRAKLNIDLTGLLRGSSEQRAAFWKVMREQGIMTVE